MTKTTQKMQIACDNAIHRAGKTMIGSIGASPEMMLDRVLTFAAAHMVHLTNRAEAAAAFRKCAEAVEAGTFDKFDTTKDAPRH